ncbi:MAG: hypothetical protein DMG40_16580 [Acidobacteria bacterium]|nr:MAG: hypothetical protein DMG40_16580 [Acidobacteriota bacterium]
MIERRKALTAVDTERGLLDFETFLTSRAEVDQTSASMRELVALARTYQLTVYDAVYLELARRGGLPLATLDKSLRAVTSEAGVKLLELG